jgi:hypothetical protein
MPITPALGGWRQENCKFNTSLDYTERPSLKKKKKKKDRASSGSEEIIQIQYGPCPYTRLKNNFLLSIYEIIRKSEK